MEGEADDTTEDVFVDELPEYLKCPICLCCLNNPYQTPCGHRFCKECILPILTSRNNVCPNDRTSIDPSNTFPDNAVKLQINGLKIRCPTKDCDWIGEYSDKQAHLSHCKFVKTECDLCGKLVLKATLEEHQLECPERKVDCPHCHVQVAFVRLDVHSSSCPETPVHCQFNCSSNSILRKNLAAHLDECPRALVPCSMEMFGCLEKVERAQLPVHLQICMPLHAVDICTQMQLLQQEVRELRGAVAAQQELIHGMEVNLYPSAGQFTWRIDDIREKVKLAQAGDVNTAVIYSPSFYSLEAGYKLSLCIYPAGDNNQGYFSLYFVIMKGRFDEILPWPFQKRVYLSLLNTRGGQSVTKDIMPDPRLHYFHRPENPRNVGYGYPKFISHTRLTPTDSEFIEHEAIFLRCRVFE